MQPISCNTPFNAEIFVFDTFAELAENTVAYLQKGKVALSGGETYNRLFPFWVRLHPDCSRASFFPVDERMVPFTDRGSNWGSVYEKFLVPLGRKAERTHFASSKKKFCDLLKRNFGTNVPKFDAVFLGVGEDGHTAGLFPEKPYLDDLRSIVLRTASPRPPLRRLSLGMLPLIAAKNLIVVIAGEKKAGMVRKLLSGDNDLPIVKVLTKRNRSKVFVDRSLVP